MPLKKEKLTKEEKVSEKASIAHFYSYKGKPMVKFKGNFFGGGFSLSKNKVNAVISNLKGLEDFAAGKYDEEIAKLSEDDILKP